MTSEQLYHAYPAFRALIGEFADWEFVYDNPYEVIEPAARGLDHLGAALARDLTVLIRKVPEDEPLRECISKELNVYFRDVSEALRFMNLILIKVEEGAPSDRDDK